MNRTDLHYENRIRTLKSRGRDNGNIVKKLERKRRKLNNN